MDKLIERFIQLTEYTYVYGEEHQLVKFLPEGIQQDEIGNYFIEIGETETMFCCHLDTAAFKKEKVQHDFWRSKKTGDLFVGTTGDTKPYTYTNASGETITKMMLDSTILGADDKAGVVVLLHLIDRKVPGLYYFFIGEETGRVGSGGITRKNPDKFRKYKRCVAFDRRDYGSIISKQIGKVCCSEEFVKALSEEFRKNGMDYHDDKFGVFTDSASFMGIIPECTNLSVGYFNEHTEDEFQNLTYLKKLANAAAKIQWETLPVHRNPNPYFTPTPKRGAKRKGDLDDDELWDIFIDVDDLLSLYANVHCVNTETFVPEKEMIFVNNFTDHITPVWVHEDGSITINRTKYGDYLELKDALMAYFGYDDNYGTGRITKPSNVKEVEEEEDDLGIEEEEDLDVEEVVSDKSNSYISKMGKTFEENMNIQDFLFDVANYAMSYHKKRLTPAEMADILDRYNKSIESLIYWLYDKDNNPDKTFGISWDDDKDNFKIEIER